MSDAPPYLQVIRCPTHKAFWAIELDGYRVTPSKCCGQWTYVTRWILTRSDWLELAALATAAAERLEKKP